MNIPKLQRRRPQDVREKISIAKNGKKHTAEHNRHISEGMKRTWQRVPLLTNSCEKIMASSKADANINLN